jgi:hypothetical protein
MTFWQEVMAGFLGNVLAGFLLVALYVLIQWFLQLTDITIGYNWRYNGTLDDAQIVRPAFDIRNLSRSRTYALSNIAYLKNGKPVASFDNNSVWGVELRPSSIVHAEGQPVSAFHSVREAMETEVHVRLQGKRMFWLQGVGPGQERKGRLQRAAFRVREWLESKAFPLE